MIVAPLIAAFFAILVLIKSYDEFRKGREPLPVFLFWAASWLIVLGIAFFPQATIWLKDHVFGKDSGLGTIFGIAIAFLLFLSYRLYSKAERVERDMNRLISQLALRDTDLSNSKD